MIARVVPINRRPPKRKEGFDDSDYRAWLKTWPCWVCYELHCRLHNFNPVPFRAYADAREMFYQEVSYWGCGETQAAHVGTRGLGQRCADKFAIPLGKLHHMHPTAGGGQESIHALGRNFWMHFKLDREEILAELHKLYQQETGRKL